MEFHYSNDSNIPSLLLDFMSDILNKTIVLVLNRNWQAINIRTPQEAFCQMATNVATALEIDGENLIRPVTWDEWITLPIRPQDNAVRTAHREIRVPTLVLHRAGDRAIKVEQGRYIAERIPGARYVGLSGEDHFAGAGDTDADGFADPIFLWDGETNLLHVRLFLLGSSSQNMPVVRKVESVMFFRNEPEL